jgi:proteasome accessory factor A
VDRLLGVETEYGFAGPPRYDSRERGMYLSWLLDAARRRFRHLPDYGGGLYLENGSRLYVDCGNHPEVATPECADPWDVVRYILAGERMLVDLLADVERLDYSSCSLFKCNVSYGGALTTWGCHESYLHRADPRLLSFQIIPHLVSRIIYTGAGGFNPFSSGIEFTLSPRVWHISSAVSQNSTHDRGIFHTKDESLSRAGYHRLHIICGESLSSETAMWLKSATTVLVVAMIEAGLDFGSALELESPVGAMRAFASDPTCKAVAGLKNGRSLSAVEIQCHYLERAEALIRGSSPAKDCLPEWAGTVCREWRKMLNLLLDAPDSVSRSLDWAIKHALYSHHARARGIEWQALPTWNDVIARLRNSVASVLTSSEETEIDKVINNDSVQEGLRASEQILMNHGQNPMAPKDFIKFRQELFEIDMRFGQLGGKGLFAAMDRAGVLAHHFAGVERIGEAVTDPPATGRARIRGEFIRKNAETAGNYMCDWQSVSDLQGDLVLDLSDPFETGERWRSKTVIERVAFI